MKKCRQIFKKINDKIETFKNQLNAANKNIDDGNDKLQSVLQAKHLDRNSLQSAQSKIEIGLERKRKIETEIEALKAKRLKLTK